MFLDHTQRRSTVRRTPLDEWSARRRDLYLTTHDTHNRQISMPPVGFEPMILSRRAAAGRSPAEILGWNPTGGMDVCLSWVFVLSGRGLCDEPITRPEESYGLCCVVVCDLQTSRIGAPYIYDISNLRVNLCISHKQFNVLSVPTPVQNTIIFYFFWINLPRTALESCLSITIQ